MAEGAQGALPSKDRLKTLLLSGPERGRKAWIARQYGVSRQAVDDAIKRHGLEGVVAAVRLPTAADMLPWTVKAVHHQTYPDRMLRFYYRSMGLGSPVTAPKELGQLEIFLRTMAEEGKVVDYDPEQGFSFVPANPGDRYLVRWPAGVPDTRDAVLARVRASD